MTPVHISPNRSIRIILEVKMPFTIFIHQPIGIVHPAISGSMVIHRTIAVGVCGIKFIICFQIVPTQSVGFGLILHFNHCILIGLGAVCHLKRHVIVNTRHCQAHIHPRVGSRTCVVSHLCFRSILLDRKQQIFLSIADVYYHHIV